MSKKEFKQPEFKIKNLKFDDNFKHEFGDDFIYLRFEIHSPGWEEPPFINYGLTMTMVVKFIWEKDPEVGKHIDEIRHGMIGLGPMESKVLNQLLEEGFDFLPWVRDFVQELVPLEDEYDRILSLSRLSPTQPDFKAIADDLKSTASEIRDSVQLQEKLFMPIFEASSNAANETCPELLDLEPEEIIEVKNLIHEHSEKLSGALARLILGEEEF